MASKATLRCLVLERHEWETGAAGHQLQIPLAAALRFFGANEKDIRVRLATAKKTVVKCTISAIYKTKPGKARSSRTRRINRLPWIGFMGHCFVFLQETNKGDLYDLWVQYDTTIVAAAFSGWEQAAVGGSGRGRRGSRGRLYNIVSAPVPIPITTLP